MTKLIINIPVFSLYLFNNKKNKPNLIVILYSLSHFTRERERGREIIKFQSIYFKKVLIINILFF